MIAAPDSYSRRSSYWAMSLALISEVLYRTVDFWPLPGPKDRTADAARGLLDLFLLPIVNSTILVFLICLIIGLGLTLIRRRFRKALSFASALGAFLLHLLLQTCVSAIRISGTFYPTRHALKLPRRS